MLRFLWFEEPSNPNSSVIRLRFARLVFGLCPLPAILGAVISHHLMHYKFEDLELVELIENSLYADDLVCGAENQERAFEHYVKPNTMLLKAGINLRKWNSNSIELMRRIQASESTPQGTCVQVPTITEEEESYAKSATGVQSCAEGTSLTKLLGLLWDSQTDHFTFEFSELEEYACSLPANHRSLLKDTAKIFNPLVFLVLL